MAGRPVPWASWAEWDRVRRGVQSADPTAVAAAAARIRTWRQRGRVPLSADVTESLLATQARDAALSGSTAACASSATLQAEYALAIVRFVNGISDASQKGRVAASVARNAEAAGLHPVLVEVRHSATHNQLPSLPLLRLAAAHALEWLRESYWDRQRTFLDAGRASVAGTLDALWRNQRARAVLARGAPAESASSADSDSGADEAPQASAAALKREQRSLLGALRAAAHASRAEDIAGVLAESVASGLFMPEEEGAPGGTREGRRTPAAQLFHTNVLVLLDGQFPRFSAHVLLAAARQLAAMWTATGPSECKNTGADHAAQRQQHREQVDRLLLLGDAALAAFTCTVSRSCAGREALAAEWVQIVGGALSARSGGMDAAEHAVALRARLALSGDMHSGFLSLLSRGPGPDTEAAACGPTEVRTVLCIPERRSKDGSGQLVSKHGL